MSDFYKGKRSPNGANKPSGKPVNNSARAEYTTIGEPVIVEADGSNNFWEVAVKESHVADFDPVKFISVSRCYIDKNTNTKKYKQTLTIPINALSNEKKIALINAIGDSLDIKTEDEV